MDSSAFTEGDEVQHKTGKVKMVYVGKGTIGEAVCEWVVPAGHPQRASFAFAALKKYERPSVGVVRVGRS